MSMVCEKRPDAVRVPVMMKKYFEIRLTEMMKEYGLSPSYGSFIMELSKEEGLTHKELTERVGIHKSLTTRVLKILFEEGVAENRSSEKEYSIYLTEKGVLIKEEITEILDESIRYLFSNLTPEELELLRSIQKKIESNINQYYSLQHRPPE